MKKMLFKAIALLLGLAMGLSFAACGDDEPQAPKKTDTVVVNYYMSLSDDYYDLWDIEVSYTGAGGQMTTEAADMDWSLELKLNAADEIPTKYAFKVVAKPKAKAPTPDPDKLYTLTSECFVRISCQDKDGKELTAAGMIFPEPERVTISGRKLAELLTKPQTIINREYSVIIE